MTAGSFEAAFAWKSLEVSRRAAKMKRYVASLARFGILATLLGNSKAVTFTMTTKLRVIPRTSSRLAMKLFCPLHRGRRKAMDPYKRQQYSRQESHESSHISLPGQRKAATSVLEPSLYYTFSQSVCTSVFPLSSPGRHV